MKPHSTRDKRFVSNQWRSILLHSATKYCHCIMILKLWAFWADSPQTEHTETPFHSIAPVSSKLRTILYMQTPVQQYLIIHTANEGKSKFPSHSNTKTAGAIQELKRHEQHTWYPGQCSFHWRYILALLWIKNDMTTMQQASHTAIYGHSNTSALWIWMRPCRTDDLIVMISTFFLFFLFLLVILFIYFLIFFL